MQDGSTDWSSHSLRWIADRNPFYLLSACCGLLGCWMLGSMSRQGVLEVALRIMGVLAYELLVVWLGTRLAKNPSMRRDAAILSVLTLILLADFSFFYMQAAMLKMVPAVVFTFFGCSQSLCVMGFLLRGFRVHLQRSGRWVLAMNLVVVHLLPLSLRWAIEHAINLPLAFLAGFTVAGAVVGAYALPWRWRLDESAVRSSKSDFATDLGRALALLAPAVMLISLAVHLVAVEWMHDVEFMMVFASPVFLGLACVCLRMDSSGARFAREGTYVGEIMPSSVACIAAVFAVLLALGDAPAHAIRDGGGWSWLGFSPLRVVLVAAAAVFFKTWRLQRHKGAFVVSVVAFFAAILGHTTEIIGRHFDDLVIGSERLLARLVPVSRQGWGLVLFSLAFVLLGIGAWLSSWKTRDSQ